MYSDLAPWFHLLTHPSDYEDEAAFVGRVVDDVAIGDARTLLELGSGGGNNASHLKTRFDCTLTDISPEMLALSRSLNPECEHLEGDMRTLRLGREFDVVFIHDAISYLTTEEDLRAAIETAATHVRPGGVVVFQELDLNQSTAAWSLPEGTLWSETGRLLIETFLRAGMQPRMGRRLFAEFNAAGLSIPEMRDEALVGGGPDFEGYLWLAGLARSLAPVMKKLAITDTDRLDLGTLTDRLRQDAIAKGAVVWMPSLVGAYAHRP